MRFWGWTIVFAAVLLLLVVGTIRFLLSSHFNIDKIFVSPTVYMSRDEILELSGLSDAVAPARPWSSGQDGQVQASWGQPDGLAGGSSHAGEAAGARGGVNLFTLDLRRCRSLLEDHPRIRRATLRRVLPSTLRIDVEERKPIALVSLNKLYEVDEDGVILPVKRGVTDFDLPVITGVLGEDVDREKVRYALRVLGEIALLDPSFIDRVAEIDVGDERNAVIYTVDGVRVWLGRDHTREKIIYLKGILQDFRGKEDSIEYVDLRFRGKGAVKFREGR
ncbi:MAG: cell division protein FtsQ/DivIB [bacterium]